MADRFFVSTPIKKPEDVIPHLAEGVRHWKKGYSAYELAYSWVKADGIPSPVRAVLEQSEEFQGMELVEGFFERETELRSRGRPSQTDLLALISNGDGCAILGIEGKVNEPFGQLVSEWISGGSDGKHKRLSVLTETLGLKDHDTGRLRYQLLHRTAAALFEAHRYRTSKAVMLVHSFSADHRWFNDFRAFSEAIGVPVEEVNQLSEPVIVESVSLRIGWVADTPQP